MRKLSEIKIGDKTVTVRELTVAQVEQQFESMAKQQTPTTLDWLFAETYMPQSVLEKITGVDTASLLTEDTVPSDLKPLYEEAIKNNSFLAIALSQMRMIASLMEGPRILTGSEQPPST